MGREQENPTVGETLDGVSLWDEHRPQSGEDWVAVAGRFLADGADTADSSPLFAGLVLAVAERDRLREALAGLERTARIYHREFHHSTDDDYPEAVEFHNALTAARSALSPESNPEGKR